VVSLGLRALYLREPDRIDLSEPPAFIAAEGLVGLMGRHVLNGARPVFYYGQAYMGAQEAYLGACVFRLFGSSMNTLRLVPMFFAMTWVPLAGAIAWRLYGKRAAVFAARDGIWSDACRCQWGGACWPPSR
jgi:hypothetical protein